MTILQTVAGILIFFSLITLLILPIIFVILVISLRINSVFKYDKLLINSSICLCFIYILSTIFGHYQEIFNKNNSILISDIASGGVINWSLLMYLLSVKNWWHISYVIVFYVISFIAENSVRYLFYNNLLSNSNITASYLYLVVYFVLLVLVFLVLPVKLYQMNYIAKG